ncbi:hypothetical protein P5705_23875 [Pseudomonas entomophila]|uniref:DUF6543 domain-containing protein n=1 Tax=Pseudomonas entomophila TaxID=312306 RepID=UPI0024066C91|nr:DUF6543 domain-containing protein [Pseudomonas entomophila]MDF9620700.1 hypothetical protein [Pseudomonas entomophila]
MSNCAATCSIKRRLALWESAGLDTLMIAGLFVLAVGTFMLAVTAFQLLDEAYEAWHAGDRHLALRHLAAVGLNLGLMAGLHVAGKVLPRLFNSPLLEGLDSITLDDGSQRLRKPDLAPYQSSVELPETVRPNAKGQYLHQGQHFIRIEGRTYRQALDSTTGRWRVLIKSGEGFEVYKGDRPVAGHQHRTLLDALHDALPEAMRGALPVDRPEALVGLIRRQAVQARSDWPHRLWGLKRPSLRLGLRGGTPLTAQPVLQSPRNALFARYRRIYPKVSDAQISQAFANWRQRLIAPEAELLVRERSLRDLRERLGAWAGEIPRRRRAARAILNAWRRTTFARLLDGRALHSFDLSGLALENHDIADLTLSEGFTHIEDLNLSDNAALSHLPEPLLSAFPRLTRLSLGKCRFSHPPQVAVPPRLTWLDMESNRVTWDDHAQATLDRLFNLALLDLSGNPLLRAPHSTACQACDRCCSITRT